MKCIKCGEGKVLTDFDPIKKRQGDYLVCKKCQLTKKCTKCGITKNILEFYADKKTKDGLTYWCRSCTAKQRKKNRYGEEKTARHVEIRRRIEAEAELKAIEDKCLI